MPQTDIPRLISEAKKALDEERKKYDKDIDDSIKSFRKKTLAAM